MALAQAAVAGLATSAAAAYLNAKYHIAKDVRALHLMQRAQKAYGKALQEKRASLFYLFEDACKQWPANPAIWSREGGYTRKQTYERVCQYANHFLSLGVKPGEIVGLYKMNSPEFVFIWIGLWCIGCAPAMINWNLASDALVHCVKISGARILIADDDKACQTRIQASRDRIEGGLGTTIIALTDDLKQNIALSDASRPADSYRLGITHPHNPIALIYTSGTTGLPKAFGFQNGRHYPYVEISKTFIGQVPCQDTWYCCMPMYHGTGGLIAINCLMNGATLAIGKKFSISGFWDDIRDSGATMFVYVGETPRYLLSAPPSPNDKNHNLRLMYGNGMRPDVWKKFQERFGVPEVAEFFNSTEGMFGTLIWSRSGFGAGSVGHNGLVMRQVLHNTYVPVKIDPETGEMWRDPITGFAKRNKYSEGGEIIVKMIGRADWPGYYKSEAATNKKIACNVFQKGDVYYRPGDALRRDDDGLWYFLDRLGDTYRWKGENVSTAEVSEVMGGYPGIQEANVYGVLLPNHEGRAGCAAIVLDPGRRHDFDWKGLAHYARSKLPNYAVPVFVRVIIGEAGVMGTHNNKQNKVPFRDEGVDPECRGSKVPSGASDEIFWLNSKSDRYAPFDKNEWEGIRARQVKL